MCWKIKNAPKGAVIDLFEDQNGNLGTGRQLATGRPATGCFDVPTGDFEPGRHWVYGSVRIGSQPLDQRYWPIPITITNPAALPAPANLTVTPTADGASVAWSEVDGASSYVVRAEPVDDQRGEPIEQDVVGTASSADLSLRGAKDWNVFVQAIDNGAKRGNLAGPVAVTPTDGVVLAGKPNGVAEVGKPWAFQLETSPGVALKLISGPPGMAIVGSSAQLRWTPAKVAGAAAPQQFVVEGCKADRCVRRTFNISAYAKGYAPFGPARGFQVTPNVVKKGVTVTIRAQGIDAEADREDRRRGGQGREGAERGRARVQGAGAGRGSARGVAPDRLRRSGAEGGCAGGVLAAPSSHRRSTAAPSVVVASI